MSVGNVKKFYGVLSQDKEMQQKFIDLNQKYQGQSVDEAKSMAIMEEEGLPLAKKIGYDFTWDDLKAYGEEMQQVDMNRELSDEELAAVSGGRLICEFMLGSSYDYSAKKSDGFCSILGFDAAGNCCFVTGGIS